MKNKLSDEWNAILRRDNLIPAPCCDRRPFTCNFNGFPDECHVVFIGQNPKNPLGVDWWNLWGDHTGFDYDLFMQVYLDGTTSETRKFYQSIAELSCKSIETNVYSHCHKQPSSISNKQVLHALLDNLPRDKRIGLIPHGKKAQRFISTYTVPDEWRILEPPLRTLLGRASNDEKDRVKRFCQRMIPMKPPERRNLESLQVNSKNSKESHQ